MSDKRESATNSIREMKRHIYTPQVRDLVDPRHPFDWWRARESRALVNSNFSYTPPSHNSDSLITEVLRSGKPALIGRLGASEARFIGECFKLRRWERLGVSRDIGKYLHPRWKPRLREIDNGTGFLYEDWGSIDHFNNQYVAALKSTDVVGIWGTPFAWPERIALRNMSPIRAVPLEHTAPWLVARLSTFQLNQLRSAPYIPWSQALAGKRVVVVSPFTKTISSQFNVRHKLFPGHSYPEFELRLVKAPWITHASSRDGYGWRWHLDDLKRQLASEPFDVAMISAGALAYPLAHHAKNLGRVGIHAGGALQLFFGILGKRWESRPNIMAFVNESWTRPSRSETPPNALALDDGCYW
jgi:hypothetical protein